MSVAQVQPDVRFFLETVWGDTEGVAYLAFAERDQEASRVKTWDRRFYSWPQDADKILADIKERRVSEEVYYAPALFHPRGKQTAGKEDVLGAHVVWVDFDGNVPAMDALLGVAPPTIRITSSPGHEHWYWKVDSFLGADELDRINRALAYLYHADASGWDANQVLRPPETFNHKRRNLVDVVEFSNTALPVGFFEGIPEPPPLIAVVEPTDLPSVESVVFKHTFPEQVAATFRDHIVEPGRGKALMFLGYSFAELNLSNAEMLSLLMHADERWGKFYGRSDRMKRLMEIVSLARQKYPFKSQGMDKPVMEFMGFKTLLATEVHLEWVWHGYLQKGGYMLLTGPPGVGKTQFSLYMGCMMALGRDALGRKVGPPSKIAFFSMEMGLTDLKSFMELLAGHFTPDELDVLEVNFQVLPLGEPLYTNREEVRTEIEQAIERMELDGVMFDSLSSTTEGEIRDEKTVKVLMDWNDHLRAKFGIFSWIVHHHRKATSDNRKPNKLDDVYGPYLLTARATTVFCLWPNPVANAIEVIPLKVRLTQKPVPFFIRREPTLAMSLVSDVIATTKAPVSANEDFTVTDEPVVPPTPRKPSLDI